MFDRLAVFLGMKSKKTPVFQKEDLCIISTTPKTKAGGHVGVFFSAS
jgi:hypothetical protein